MGIRLRVAGSYIAVIVTAIVILELFLAVSVKSYYLSNAERILMNQGELSASFYRQYFSDEPLEAQSDRLLAGFAHQSAAQVQIIDASGKLLRDSNGSPLGNDLTSFPDVRSALGGHSDSWRGREETTNEPVLAVSYPLQGDNGTVGAVRFVTSLSGTLRAIKQMTGMLVFAGCIVVGFVAIVGSLLSRTITGPIKDLKRAAEKMGQGDFTVRVGKRYDDELGTLADTLNSMAAKIGESEKLKNDFMASVSHELRTPLTSIKGWAATLRTADGTTDEQLLKEGLAIIESESDRLTRLVDELLDLSAWEEGAVRLRLAPVRLPGLLRGIGKQLAPRANRQRVDLAVHPDDGLPVIVADENRLKQVIVNLLDNALKFTPSGGSVQVRAGREADRIVIAVEDTGEGIPGRDLTKVFGKFFKSEGRAGGSGLGLAISERIVALHGGRMTIESEVGRGTIFRVYLPVRSPNLTNS